MKKQPFLTSFPLAVFATATRRVQAALRAQREWVVRHSISGYGLLFEAVLSPGFLEGIDPTRRQRSFGHIPVFWAWLAQILEANASCSKALGLIQSWYQASGLAAPAGGTSGYCMARKKLGEDFLAGAGEAVHHMSFKGALDLVTSSHESFRAFAHKPRKRRAHYSALIGLCATKTLDIRPLRHKPRARKRRPKNYQLLTESRHVFKENPHRESHRKTA